MALGNKTVKELPSISSGTPSGLQNTDLLYALRPGTVDSDYRVSGSDIDTFVAAKGFVRNTMTINGYTLAAPINLTYADVGAVHNTTTVNGHLLTGAVVISKGDVGLGNVLNTSTANTLAGYDNAGAFGDVAIGTGLSLIGGTLSSTVSGTVTAVSIVSAHGFSGSSSGGATPALTINCTITGVLKGDGTSISAATAGTDYVAPATTVNGHALSANVTVSASDVGLGSVTNDAQTKAAIVPNTAPSAGQILAGNAGGTAYAPVSMSGNVTMTSAGVTAIGAGQVTNTMLAGSIAASKLVGSDIATVGTLTAGATGAGFTVALTTSTITGNLPITNMPSLAANTFLANGTAGAAAPTAIALGASQLAGRGASGNIAAIALGTGLSMSGATLNAAAGGLTQGTLTASTSGTEIDFTGIPSTVKRITICFKGVSTNGTSNMLIQVGPGSYIATGYVGGGTHGATAVGSTAGFLVGVSAATGILQGTVTLTLMDAATNLWVASGTLYDTGSSTVASTGGYIALAGALTQLRITTVAGTDTFDAGAFNIVYE